MKLLCNFDWYYVQWNFSHSYTDKEVDLGYHEEQDDDVDPLGVIK